MTSTPPRSPSRHPWVVRLHGLLAAGVAWVVVFASVQAALATPAEERLSGPEVAALLDYSGLPGTVSPLSEEYIADVLGHPVPGGQEPGVQPVGSAPPPVTSEAGSPPTSDDEHPGRATASHPATNDDLADAYQVPSVPFTATTDASTATRETGEPDDCAPVGPTLWYRYAPTSDGVLIASTAGSDGVTALAVYAGRPTTTATSEACHTNVLGHAKVGFPVDAGTTYYFQVTAVLQAPDGLGEHDVVFNLDPFGQTELSSVDARGQKRDNTFTTIPSISADGRFVAFSSASPFVSEDDNDTWDVYVHDRHTGRIERASIGWDGDDPNGRSGALWVDISDDGRFVAFHSQASNLVEGDTNQVLDVFVRDRHTGTTERVSVSSDGSQGRRGISYEDGQEAVCNPGSSGICPGYGVSISASGRWVTFASELVGLVDAPLGPPDADPENVYLHDRLSGETTAVSRTRNGELAGHLSTSPDISADGRYVVYRSRSDEIDGGRPGTQDVFLYDRRAGSNQLVSVGVDGRPGNDSSGTPRIAADGRFVVFESSASNLVEDDTNGFKDVFVVDLETDVTTRESLTSTGAQVHDDQNAGTSALFSTIATISRDGRYVVFDSSAPELARGFERTQAEDHYQLYLRDRLAGTTIPLSITPDGRLGASDSLGPSMTPDGRHIVFFSTANDLSDRDRPQRCDSEPLATCGDGDVFVHTFPVLR